MSGKQEEAMTIEELGNLGEFIAAIAVLVSLVYLALQIRQNTKQVEQASFNDVYRAYSEMRQSVYTDGAIAEILVKAVAGEALSRVETIKVEAFISENLFCTLQMTRAAASINGFTQENLEAGVEATIPLLSTSVGKSYWERNKQIYPPDYQALIDSHL